MLGIPHVHGCRCMRLLLVLGACLEMCARKSCTRKTMLAGRQTMQQNIGKLCLETAALVVNRMQHTAGGKARAQMLRASCTRTTASSGSICLAKQHWFSSRRSEHEAGNVDVNRPATGQHAAGCIRVAAAHRVGSLSAGFKKFFTSLVRSMRELALCIDASIPSGGRPR